MPRRKLMPFRLRLTRHKMEYEGRWAWEEASEADRKAYQSYLQADSRGPWAAGNEEIPLSFPAFMERREARRQRRNEARRHPGRVRPRSNELAS